MWEQLTKSPRTTAIGCIVIAGAVLYLGMRAYTGTLQLTDITALLAVLSGSGFLAAKDEA